MTKGVIDFEKRDSGASGISFVKGAANCVLTRVLKELPKCLRIRDTIAKRLGRACLTANKESQDFSLECFLEAEYDDSLRATTDGKLYDTETAKLKFPSRVEILRRLSGLTLEELEVVRGMKSPMLVVVPDGLSSRKFINNLDAGTHPKNDTLSNRNGQFRLQDEALGIKEDGEITGWTIAIAEGALKLSSKPGILKDLINEWLSGKQSQKNAVLVDHTVDSLIQKRAILNGKSLDTGDWSVLSRRDDYHETVCEDGRVSGGSFSSWYDCVVFGVALPGDHFTNPCFRYMVVAPR